MSSSGKVALIYGGTGYIGSAITHALRALNITTITAGRSTSDDKSHIISDLTNEDSVKATVDQVFAEHGRLDLVIHSSSPAIERVPLLKTQQKSFSEHVAVAVNGTFNLAAIALPKISPDGAFVVITSGVIKDMNKSLKLGAYALAKQAQHDLTAQIALESKNVRVFEILPDFLPGGLNKDLPTAIQQSFAKRKDGTIASANDVANIIKAITNGLTPHNNSGIVDIATSSTTPFIS